MCGPTLPPTCCGCGESRLHTGSTQQPCHQHTHYTHLSLTNTSMHIRTQDVIENICLQRKPTLFINPSLLTVYHFSALHKKKKEICFSNNFSLLALPDHKIKQQRVLAIKGLHSRGTQRKGITHTQTYPIKKWTVARQGNKSPSPFPNQGRKLCG